MKKLSLRQKRRIVIGLLLSSFVFSVLAVMFVNHVMLWAGCISMGLLVAALVLNVKWWRCPHCCNWLGRYVPNFCPHCGGKIDYDGK